MLFIFLFVIACGDRDQAKFRTPENSGLTKDSETPRLNLSENKEPRLKRRERLLAKRRAENGKADKKIETLPNPVCRRFPGCIQFCAKWKENNIDCNQLTAKTVISLWSQFVDQYSSEQVVENLEWISKDPHVSLFLYDSDPDQKVMTKLITRLSEEECPLLESQDIFYEEKGEGQFALYLSHSEGLSHGVKKIVDPELYDFKMPLFKGLMNRCLNKKTNSFLEHTLVNKNWRGFAVASNLLHYSCGYSDDCVRLAYCKSNPSVLEYLKSVILFKEPGAQNIRQCEFDDFNSLPKEISSVSS